MSEPKIPDWDWYVKRAEQLGCTPEELIEELETVGWFFPTIHNQVNRLWRARLGRIYMWVNDKIEQKIDASQKDLFESQISEYPYPPYQELIAPLTPDEMSGELSTERKAEILLISTFEWRGLTIARETCVFGTDAQRTGLPFHKKGFC